MLWRGSRARPAAFQVEDEPPDVFDVRSTRAAHRSAVCSGVSLSATVRALERVAQGWPSTIRRGNPQDRARVGAMSVALTLGVGPSPERPAPEDQRHAGIEVRGLAVLCT